MISGRKSWIAFAVIPLMLFGAVGLADQGPDEVKCFPDGEWSISVEEEQAVSGRRYTVPRKQVLMEEATATW
jgi:hypothetical protein